tara:strand:+ start:1920 stop:2660 length:741 start_codon:yes stop_codon:yes gene_type:complete
MKFKLITAIDREPNEMFKLWYNWHKKFFKEEEFLILNYHKNLTELEKIVKKEQILQKESFNSYQLFLNNFSDFCNLLQKQLILEGFTVIFLDQDEFIIDKQIKKYISSCKEDIIVTKSWSIIQDVKEPTINWDIPILNQRHYGKEEFYNDKPSIIKNTPIDWCHGKHNNTSYKTDGKVIVLHFRDVDFDFLYQVTRENLNIYKEDKLHSQRSFWIKDEDFWGWVNTEARKNIVELPLEIKLIKDEL